MKPQVVESVIRGLLAASPDRRVHYTELARALRISPSYAAQILRAHCPGEYDRGNCYAPAEKAEVAH
jgi:hypothetical protein